MVHYIQLIVKSRKLDELKSANDIDKHQELSNLK